MASDIVALERALREAGYTISPTRRHTKVVHPLTGRMAVYASTPSDNRGVDNICHQLRRQGFTFTFRGKCYAPRPDGTT